MRISNRNNKKKLATKTVARYYIRSARIKLRRIIMPFINIKMGHISEEKKKELIVNLTNEAVRITGLKPESFMVFIEEYSYENIGVAGMTVKDRLAGAK